jgi:hypothetical protein
MSRQRILLVLTALGIVAIGFLGHAIYTTNQAHTSFERYYAFRDCVQLVDKTDTYGDCRLSGGQIIKMVLFNGKWYLDGDLPSRGGDFTF